MTKFNPFSEDVKNAVLEEKDGIVLMASTAELVQILGGEVEAQMVEQAGYNRDNWTHKNLSDVLEGRRTVIQRNTDNIDELITDETV